MFKAGHKTLISIKKGSLPANLLHLTKSTLIILFFSIATFSILLYTTTDPRLTSPTPAERDEKIKGVTTRVSVNIPNLPSPQPTQAPKKITPTPPTAQKPTSNNTATQIDENTWTTEVQEDTQVGSAQEIYNALNSYRAKNGKGALSWDTKLASYAQKRSDLFASQQSTDNHAGFNSYLDSNGFEELGFNSIGENSSYGYHVSGTKLIEQVYASDAPHNDNQLSDKWTHVGIGVNGVATNIIFAGNKQ